VLLSKKWKDIYIQTTQSEGLKAILKNRYTELAGHLTTILGTLLKTKVPRCEVAHQEEQLRRQDCGWSCQIEAIVQYATELSIKLEQRSFKTIFRWPEPGEKYDIHLMGDEDLTVLRSYAVVDKTYMPAVIDDNGSRDPVCVDKGVWYKASVSLR
jgi:hypothetical protein